jgi:hypothetical protein
MPEITLSFNASDEESVMLRSLKSFSVFDRSDSKDSFCLSGDFYSLI